MGSDPLNVSYELITGTPLITRLSGSGAGRPDGGSGAWDGGTWSSMSCPGEQ